MAMTAVTTMTMSSTTVSTNFPICLPGTRPMIIMKKMTAANKAAVDRFSNPMRTRNGKAICMMYLMAFRSAPLSVCMALRICAVIKTNAPFAISEGWNCTPMMGIHRLAPLVDCPKPSTSNSNIPAKRSMMGVNSLKYLQLMLSVTTINPKPTTMSAMCLMMGVR